MTVTIRLWIDGVLVDEAIDLGAGDDLGPIALRQRSMVEMCDAPWLLEFKFSDGDHIRMGNDARGMVAPVHVDSYEEALAVIAARWAQ